jgi:hypothetical protein
MSANGISQLTTKQEKQEAKLALAANDRTAAGNPRDTSNIELLPTKYAGNEVVDNENAGGLQQGRP